MLRITRYLRRLLHHLLSLRLHLSTRQRLHFKYYVDGYILYLLFLLLRLSIVPTVRLYLLYMCWRLQYIYYVDGCTISAIVRRLSHHSLHLRSHLSAVLTVTLYLLHRRLQCIYYFGAYMHLVCWRHTWSMYLLRRTHVIYYVDGYTTSTTSIVTPFNTFTVTPVSYTHLTLPTKA